VRRSINRNYFRRTALRSSAIRKDNTIPETQTQEVRFIVKKIALALLFALTLCPAASFAQVVIRVGPPAPIIETRGVPPDRGYVWIDGYHRWEGGAYVWTPGRWERPPHPGAHWVAHRWAHRGDHWVLIEGHWR
jgi:hypothetical protein